MRQISKMAKRGLLDAENEDPFSLFVASTNIRYCFYKDTDKVLGNTFGMCVLQVSLLQCVSTCHKSAVYTECPAILSSRKLGQTSWLSRFRQGEQ